jgi:hypothetical protein
VTFRYATRSGRADNRLEIRMMMNRPATSIAFTLGAALLALPAAAQTGSAAIGVAPKGPALVYSLTAGGKSGVLLGAEGLAASPQSEPNLRSEFALSAGTGLPQPFYDWVSAALVGKPVPFAATMEAVDASGRAGETITLANPRLIGIGLGAFDKASHAPTHMDVRLQAAVKAEPAKSAKLPKVPAHEVSARWLASGYRLTLGALDTSQVTHIGAFVMAPGTGAQLELTTSPATAQAFARTAPTPRQRAAVPIDDGQLELIGADGNVIATLALKGVQITSFSYAPPQAAGAPRPGVIGIMARLVDLRFAPAMVR